MPRRWTFAFLAGLLALGVMAAPPAGAAKVAKTAKPIPFTAATVTQSADGYDVTWAAPSSAGTVKVYAGTDADAVGTGLPVGKGESTGSLHVTGLPAAPRWYFQLFAAKGGSLVVADRSLHLASAPNFRDLGGYRTRDGRWVKMGLLYRSDGLDKLTDAETAAVQAIGVKLVCDLRTDGERAKNPDRVIAGATNEQIDVTGKDELTATLTAAVTSGDAAEQQRLFGDGKAEKLLTDGARALVSDPTPIARYRLMFTRIEDP